MLLALDKIRCDGGTQPRSKIDYLLVQEYQEAYKSGAKFPAIIVFYDGEEYWLADGFHRVSAIPVLGLDKIEAEIKQGTRDDAVWYSCSANAHHGQRRSNEDKRRAVTTALQHPKSKTLSDRAIAEHCGVSDPFVGAVRRELQTVSSSGSNEKRTGKDGKRRGQRSTPKKKQEQEKRKKQTANATRASVESRAKKAAEKQPANPAPAMDIERPSFDEVVRLAKLLTRPQQESLIRVLQRSWEEKAA